MRVLVLCLLLVGCHSIPPGPCDGDNIAKVHCPTPTVTVTP